MMSTGLKTMLDLSRKEVGELRDERDRLREARWKCEGCGCEFPKTDGDESVKFCSQCVTVRVQSKEIERLRDKLAGQEAVVAGLHAVIKSDEAIIATLPTCNGLRDGEPVDDELAYPGMSCRVRLRWIAGHPIVAGTIQSVTKTTATVSTDGYPTSEVELSDCYNSTAAAEKAREESNG